VIKLLNINSVERKGHKALC